MEDDRKARIASNEALFRAVNEKIEDVNSAFGTITETVTVVCECGEDTCIDQIELSLPCYEDVRKDPSLFVVVPGHEIPEVEQVVEHGDGFDIVRKMVGTGGAIVSATDTRG